MNKITIEQRLESCKHAFDRIEQACAKALGYPMFKDDQEVFPGASEHEGYFVGEHDAETLVEELIKAYSMKPGDCTKACFHRGVNVGRRYSKPIPETRDSLYRKLASMGFAYIVERIKPVTGTTESYKVFDDIIYDTRGNRAGFPLEAFTCILKLYLMESERPQHPEDKWSLNALR